MHMTVPPNKSVEATATRREVERCGSEIGRRIVCRRSVPVAVPHLWRSAAEETW